MNSRGAVGDIVRKMSTARRGRGNIKNRVAVPWEGTPGGRRPAVGGKNVRVLVFLARNSAW
jgi:hypothetical protein